MTPDNKLLGWLTRRHDRLVFRRRARRLIDALDELLPNEDTSLLDIGCGNGAIARGLSDRRPDLAVFGADVLARPEVAIPMKVYDGRTLPFEDNSFDAVMLIDVLHHCDDPEAVLGQAVRVGRRTVLVKDHVANSAVNRVLLRLMDWVGNAGHGVSLVYNYWSDSQWRAAWDRHGLAVTDDRRRLRLYPAWCRWLCETRKHFLACLRIETRTGP